MLKIWLPLDGDLHNQGCSNIKAITSNGVIDNNGKIGKCYFLDSTSHIYSDLFTPISNNFSLCCWYKANEGNTTSGYIFGLSKQSTPNFMLYKTGTSNFRLYINSYSSYTHNLDLTQWHHLAITYNGTEYKLYIDGEYKTQRKQTIDYTLDEYRCFLNCCSNNSNTNGTGGVFAGENYYNDFRYYDHCLSAAEVREIAQGLVLHYKLENKSIKNLFLTDPILTLTIATGGTNVFSSYVYIDPTVKNNNLFKAGTQYIIVYDYIVNSYSGNNTSYVYTQLNNSICSPTISQTMIRAPGTTGKIMEKFNVTETQANFTSDFKIRWRITNGAAGDSITIKNVRLYLDTQPDTTIISDDSGYNHTGQIVNNLSFLPNTPKYQNAAYFSNSSYIKTTNFHFPSNTWTVSCWYYRETNPSNFEALFCLSKNSGSDANKRIAAIPNTDRIWFKGESSSLSISSLNITSWTMLTMTCDGITVKIYENTNKIGEFSAGTQMSNCTDLVIGARSGSSNVSSIAVPYTGLISDFRIYCTPLLDTDIKLLYNIGMRVDNLKEIHTFSFNELSDKIQLLKTGVFKNSKLIETNNTASLNKEGNIYFSNFIEI